MKKRYIFFLLFLYSIEILQAASVAKSSSLRRGNGNLEGVIKNEKGETMPGVTIYIEDQKSGGATDANGFYKILNITEGNHSVKISSIGYKTIITQVNIIAGQKITLNLKMVEENTLLNEITITAKSSNTKPDRLRGATNTSVLSEMKNSPLIITGISAEQISRSVDFTADEVAKRLPGVTLINKFIIVRGLNERYNTTFINGMIAPSTETDTRAFSFDLLPSNMLDRIIVHRSPSPDIPGDFAGGVVKIYTRSTVQERALQINVAGQFRQGSSYTTYNTNQTGKYDWLGFDDGTRALPKGFPAKDQIPNTSQENAQFGKMLKNNWSPQKRYVDLDKRIMANYFDYWKLGKFKLNNLTSFSYSQTNTNFKSKTQRGTTTKGDVVSLYNDVIDTRTARVGGMEILDFVINENHHVEFRNIFNQLGTDETIIRGIEGKYGISTEGAGSAGENYNKFLQYSYNYRSRGLYAGNLAGTHKVGGDSSIHINWGLGYARTTENTPDQRLLEMGVPVGKENSENPYAITTLKVVTRSHSRTYLKAFENTYNFTFDLEKKFKFGPSIKIGTYNEQKERIIDARTITYVGPNDPKDSLFYRFSNPKDLSGIFSPDRFNPDGTGWRLSEDNTWSNSYIARNKLYSGYIALNIPLFNERLNIFTGVRYENNEQEVIGRQIKGGANDTLKIKKPTHFWFPSINVSYNINNKVTWRGAYGFTVNRPQLREVTPFAYFDFLYNIQLNGNPLLRTAEIHNFDTRLEWYPSSGEFIAVGAFYKRFVNIIEDLRRSGNPYDQSDPVNTSEAKVYGIEAEVRKRFDFIPVPIINNISAIANLALANSEVRLDPVFAVQDYFQRKTRPIQGFVPYVVNVSLYYDNRDLGTKVSAVYNAFGRRLRRVGYANDADLYEADRHQLDVVVRQRITKHLEINAGVQDIFNQRVMYYQDWDKNKWYTPNLRNKLGKKDFKQLEYKPGSYYTFGLILTL